MHSESPAPEPPRGGGPRSVASRNREEDREDVRACQRGEKQGFDRLVERYQRDVYRLCYRYVNNHHDANDMAQESFLRAYRALPRFRGESSFSTWLYRIAVNACLNFRTQSKPEGTELPESLPSPGESAVESMEKGEIQDRIRAA